MEGRPLKRAQVENTAKTGLLLDLDHITARVSKALRGDVKFLDARVRLVTQALKQLQAARDLLNMGLVPTNLE